MRGSESLLTQVSTGALLECAPVRSRLAVTSSRLGQAGATTARGNLRETVYGPGMVLLLLMTLQIEMLRHWQRDAPGRSQQESCAASSFDTSSS